MSRANGENSKIRAHIFVSGRVQGVFFREKTRQKAKKLGIMGWIRNLPDKRVEAVFEGEEEKIKKMVKWARRGTFLAKVDRIEVGWQKFSGEFKEFEIRFANV